MAGDRCGGVDLVDEQVMPFHEETVWTGRDGRLHGRYWSVGDDARGVMILVHGLGDHGGRYRALAQELAVEGWNLFAFDLPGHGESPGRRGHVDRYDQLLEEIAAARATVCGRAARLPQVILGHSMGGNLALNYVLRRDQFDQSAGEPAGLVLSAPMLLPPNPPPRPKILAAWLTGLLLPWIPIGKRPQTSQLTSEPQAAAAFQNDPLMHGRISIYLATQLLSQGRWALDHARRVDLPTLIMHGEADQLIDCSACQHLAIRIGERATLAVWPETRHDLFHDRSRKEVVARVTQWLRDLAR